MARKFLYVIAGLVVLVIAALLVYRVWGMQLIRAVMIPREAFAQLPPLPADAYDKQAMWIARPDIVKDNPALWTPQGIKDAPVPEKAAVFFIHPTSYITTFGDAHWNARLDDKEAASTARRFVGGQASAFNAAGNIWAPRYRQANYGAFLTDGPEGDKALAVAYRDVAQAFAAFLKANPTGPLILAGHSQGRATCCNCCANKSRASRSRSGSPRSMPWAGRFRSRQTCPHSACLPARGRRRRIASSVGKAMPNR